MRRYDAQHKPDRVWAPSTDCSHPEHLAAARAAAAVFGDRVETYETYEIRDGKPDKVRTSREVEPSAEAVVAKLRALSRYETQVSHGRARAFFMMDLREYR